IEVSNDHVMQTTRRPGGESGLLVAIASGADVSAARQVAKETSGSVVTVLPDCDEQHFSASPL
ncbi:MAG TPA: cysteine synthase A, partial [Phycisphaerae bacterium]|nr:cysteine synthase A [Phycisphaerae bacterium]